MDRKESQSLFGLLCLSFGRFTVGMGFSVVYGALLTKTNRISRIFHSASQSARRPSYISPRSQLMITAVLVTTLHDKCYFLIFPPFLLRCLCNFVPLWSGFWQPFPGLERCIHVETKSFSNAMSTTPLSWCHRQDEDVIFSTSSSLILNHMFFIIRCTTWF